MTHHYYINILLILFYVYSFIIELLDMLLNLVDWFFDLSIDESNINLSIVFNNALLMFIYSEILLFLSFITIVYFIQSKSFLPAHIFELNTILLMHPSIQIAFSKTYNILLIIFIDGLLFLLYTIEEFKALPYSLNDSIETSAYFTLIFIHYFHFLIGVLFILQQYYTEFIMISLSNYCNILHISNSYLLMYQLFYWHLIEGLWILIDFLYYTH